MPPAPNLRTGVSKVVAGKLTKYQWAAHERCAKYKKFVLFAGSDGFYHITYRRDWRKFEGEIVVLRMTGTRCSCSMQHYASHKMWEFVDEYDNNNG